MATNECILLRGKTPITDRTVSLCQGLIAEHSDNIGRLSAIFRQQHPSGKVMTSQGDLKPGAAFLCSQITNTYTVPPHWCLPCHGKMSTERFQRRHNKTVIDICAKMPIGKLCDATTDPSLLSSPFSVTCSASAVKNTYTSAQNARISLYKGNKR